MANWNYELNQIKSKLDNEIATTEMRISLWKDVSFPAKKDGSEFKTMSKNISGATYRLREYANGAGEYELFVSICKNGRYAADSINCYECICYMKDKEKLAKTQNYMPKQEYLNQIYCYDLDDIKQAIKNRVEFLENYLAELKQEAGILDSVFYTFISDIQGAVDNMRNTVGVSSYLYCELKSTVRENFSQF